MRRTKIVATIGPATRSPEALSALVGAGIDVARLNASHADVDELDALLAAVRAAASLAGRHVGVMLDLPGPKLRLGEIQDGAVLETGAQFVLVKTPCTGDATRACVTNADLAGDVSPGDRVLLDDGGIELSVLAAEGEEVRTLVVSGGPLTSHKGVNVPDVTLAVDIITDADREALEWGLSAGVDIVAQSFVRSAEDVLDLREVVGGSGIPIVAKIEKHEAVASIEAIVEAADAVMVARGDLGVETSPEEVPVLQRRIIAACRDAGRPVIVATQMLESMIDSPRPTRAEASDVANAIFDRVDAVMLSAETAIGRYPAEAVATMALIVRRAEASLEPVAHDRVPATDSSVTHAVSAAVCELAEDLRAAAILTATQSGATARAVARHRPSVPIVAVTPSEAVARQLELVWGTETVVAPVASAEDLALEGLVAAVRDEGLVMAGDIVAITAGVVRGKPGTTDLILVREVPA
ncbi:MAG: pyruvate kinase [Coriobacteriia bacterium]|nr:pyruvate kinase [Coriobacteriia bacterium]